MQRYESTEYDGMIPVSDGDWVKSEDARELERENARLREALLRLRTWGIRARNFDAQDNRAMAEWVDAGCAGPLPTPDGPWIYSVMAQRRSDQFGGR